VLTDVAGLYADWPNRDSLVSHLTASELRDAAAARVGHDPEDAGVPRRVDGGVDTAAIIDGRQPHSVLVEIFTEQGIGTEVVAQ
jgi:acetylglutamate kinase